jgi:hypothetical protein
MSEYKHELLTPITSGVAITRMINGEVLYARLIPDGKWARAFRIADDGFGFGLRLQIQNSGSDDKWQNYHCPFNTVIGFAWFSNMD